MTIRGSLFNQFNDHARFVVSAERHDYKTMRTLAFAVLVRETAWIVKMKTRKVSLESWISDQANSDRLSEVRIARMFPTTKAENYSNLVSIAKEIFLATNACDVSWMGVLYLTEIMFFFMREAVANPFQTRQSLIWQATSQLAWCQFPHAIACIVAPDAEVDVRISTLTKLNGESKTLIEPIVMTIESEKRSAEAFKTLVVEMSQLVLTSQNPIMLY